MPDERVAYQRHDGIWVWLKPRTFEEVGFMSEEEIAAEKERRAAATPTPEAAPTGGAVESTEEEPAEAAGGGPPRPPEVPPPPPPRPGLTRAPLTREEDDALRRWNDDKPDWADSIGAGEAQDARSYMAAYQGLVFEEALDMFARWRAGQVGVPSPSGASAAVSLAGGREMFGPAFEQFPGYAEAQAAAARSSNIFGNVPDTSLTQAIVARTDDPKVQWAMMIGAIGEGGSLSPTASGEWPYNATSGAAGPYQILPSHDLRDEEANDPTIAVGFMTEGGVDVRGQHFEHHTSYEDGVAYVDANYPELWATDPVTAGLLAAGYAEKPAGFGIPNPTPETARSTYAHAYPNIERELSMAPGTAGSGVITTTEAARAILGGPPPGPEGIPTSIPIEEYPLFEAMKARFGITEGQYLAGNEAVRQGLYPDWRAWWDEINEREARRLAEEGHIPWTVYEEGEARNLSAVQMRNTVDWEISVARYADILDQGFPDSHIRSAVQLGFEPEEYVWAIGEGLSTEAIRKAALENISLPQAVYDARLEARLEGATAEATEAFEKDWEKLVKGLDPALVAELGTYLTQKHDEALKERLEADLQVAEAGAARETRAEMYAELGIPPEEQEPEPLAPIARLVHMPTEGELIQGAINIGLPTRVPPDAKGREVGPVQRGTRRGPGAPATLGGTAPTGRPKIFTRPLGQIQTPFMGRTKLGEAEFMRRAKEALRRKGITEAVTPEQGIAELVRRAEFEEPPEEEEKLPKRRRRIEIPQTAAKPRRHLPIGVKLF